MITTEAKNLQIAFNVAMFWRELKESIFQVEVNEDAMQRLGVQSRMEAFQLISSRVDLTNKMLQACLVLQR